MGGGILQRDSISGVPPDLIGLRLDQMVRGENLALLIENQRRQTEQCQRLACDACAFQLKPRRHKRAAREVGPQHIKLVDDGGLDRTACMKSLQGKTERLTLSSEMSEENAGAKIRICGGEAVLRGHTDPAAA